MGIVRITDRRSTYSWSVVMITLLGFVARNFSARHSGVYTARVPGSGPQHTKGASGEGAG